MCTICCFALALVGLATPSLGQPLPSERRIAVADYQDRVWASWWGQIVGNIYDLSYELRFLEEPGPDAFPCGYGPSLARVLSGAFSDDNTDIKYLSLLQLEQHPVS